MSSSKIIRENILFWNAGVKPGSGGPHHGHALSNHRKSAHSQGSGMYPVIEHCAVTGGGNTTGMLRSSMRMHRAIRFAVRDDLASTATFLGTEEKGIVRQSFQLSVWKNILDRSKDATRRRQGASLADHQEVVGLVSMMFTSVMASRRVRQLRSPRTMMRFVS
jgi:hypothetical protein